MTALQDPHPSTGSGCVTVQSHVVVLGSVQKQPYHKVVGIDVFGESAPAGELFQHFGFTATNVGKAIDEVCA